MKISAQGKKKIYKALTSYYDKGLDVDGLDEVDFGQGDFDQGVVLTKKEALIIENFFGAVYACASNFDLDQEEFWAWNQLKGRIKKANFN